MQELVPFCCDRCGKTMATEGGFTVHLATHVAEVGASQHAFDRQAVLTAARPGELRPERARPATPPAPRSSIPADESGDGTQGHRWNGRPVQAFFLRLFVMGVPILAAVAASIAISRTLPYPRNFGVVVVWWIGVFAASTSVMMVVDRFARRLLPLATLLKLSMLFPDRAPSRFGVALKSGTVKNLEEKLENVRLHGVDDEPARAARQILELVGMLNTHDPRTRGHSERVRAFTALLAAEMKLPQADRDRLHWAALLHDVGKVMVPHEILHKEGKPDAEEWARLHRHPEDGDRLAAPLRPWLGPWADAIVQHHEQWDGSGYPHHLAGEQISLAARIVAVADAFEVMTATRSYKSSMDVKSAREELIRCSGTHFDPDVVRAFLNLGMNKLRWTAGPLAWLAQLPFLQGIPSGIPTQVAVAGGRALAGVAVFAGVAAPSTPPPKPAEKGYAVAIPKGAPAPAAHAGKTTATTGPRHLVAGNAPPPSLAPTPTPTSAPLHLVAGNEPLPSPAPPAPTTSTTRRPAVPPIARDDVVTTSQSSPQSVDVTKNDAAPSGDRLVMPVKVLNQPGGINANVKSDGHVINVVPNNQPPGVYAFQYQVCDTSGGCAVATVTITVTSGSHS